MEPRPYYHRFAWAYDLLQSGPIEARVQFIMRELHERDVQPPKLILDAGCGTGRYSAELAARGFCVIGVDQSSELIAIARNRAVAGRKVRYEISNLLTFEPLISCDAVLCRGVLNDFTNQADRSRIIQKFANWLSPAGVLIFDVRDWDASASRYSEQPIARRHVDLGGENELLFESRTVPNHSTHELNVQEEFEHRHEGKIVRTKNEFTMRCWSRSELMLELAKEFRDVSIHPTYGEPTSVWSDRLVVIATAKSL